MEMEFVRHEPCYDRILFVLTLDRKKMKERILIGEELQVRFRLQGDMDARLERSLQSLNMTLTGNGTALAWLR